MVGGWGGRTVGGGGGWGRGAGATATETGNRRWRWGAWGPVGGGGRSGHRHSLQVEGDDWESERVYRHANLPIIRTKECNKKIKLQYQLHYQQFRVTIFKVSIAKEGTEAVRAEPEYDSFGWQQFCPEVGSRLREYSVCSVKLTGRPLHYTFFFSFFFLGGGG